MYKTFTLQLRPNSSQTTMFEHILDYNCETYNAALQEKKEAWKLQKKNITLFDQQKQIAELRKEPQYRIIGSEIQRDPLHRLHKSYSGYFQRCKEGKKPGHPRFRSRQRYTSFTFGGSAAIKIKRQKLLIPKLGYVRFKTSQILAGVPKEVTVKKICRKWVIRLVCEIGPAPERQPVSTAIGIDLGITKFLTSNNGSFVENPKWLKKHENRIAFAQKRLMSKRCKSKNRLKAKEVLRRVYQKMTDAKRNFLHHVSKHLVTNYDLIAFEKLEISQMVQSSFAKSIYDVSWGELIWQLTYKAEYAGKWAVPVNPRGTTSKCSRCGFNKKKEIWEREHNCGCGLILDRDHNAAINILRLGRSLVGLSAE